MLYVADGRCIELLSASTGCKVSPSFVYSFALNSCRVYTRVGGTVVVLVCLQCSGITGTKLYMLDLELINCEQATLLLK